MTDVNRRIDVFDLFVQNTACIERTATMKQNLEIDRVLRVNGTAQTRGPISIAGAIKVTGTESSTSDSSGAVTVAGGMGVAGDMFIENIASIDSGLTFPTPQTVTDTTESTDKDTGALIVEGGFGIEENLNVGGNLGFSGLLNVADVTNSVSPATGAMTVAGGIGIGKNLQIGGNLNVAGVTTVSGPLIVTDTTQSVDKDTGAIITEGGVGVEENVNVGGDMQIVGQLSVDDVTESTNNNTGALILENGGFSVDKNLFIGGRCEVGSNEQSSGGITGALNLNGGAGIGGNIYIGEDAVFDNSGGTSNMIVLDTTPCTSISTGSIVTAGGVGVELGLCVGDTGTFDGDLTANAGVSSTSTATGSLVIPGGGIGVTENVNVGGTGNFAGTDTVEIITLVPGGAPDVSDVSTGFVFEVAQQGTDTVPEISRVTVPAGTVAATLGNTSFLLKAAGLIIAITNAAAGSVTDIIDVDTGFTFAVTQQGTGALPEISTVTISSSTVAATLGDTNFQIEAAGGTMYHVWYNLDTLGVDPGTTANPIEVMITTGDSPETIATATQAAIDAEGDFGAALPANHHVWYNLDTLGVDPGGSPNPIEVMVATGFTEHQVADATAQAINSNINFSSRVIPTLEICDTAGSLIVDGSVTVGGDTNIGGGLSFAGDLAITDPSASALSVVGGIGIGENLYVGGTGPNTFGEFLQILDTTGTAAPPPALVVEGGVGVSENLNVGGTGTFAGEVTVNSTIPCTSSTTGALVVGGGVGVDENMCVEGAVKFADDVTINNFLFVQDLATTGSTSTTTGAVTVDGGVGISQDSFIGERFIVESALNSSDKDTGGVVVEGGVGIAADLNAGGLLETDGLITVTFVSGSNTISSTDPSSAPGNGAFVVAGAVGVGAGAIGVSGNMCVAERVMIDDTTDATGVDAALRLPNGGIIVREAVNVLEIFDMNGPIKVLDVVRATDTTIASGFVDGSVIVSGGSSVAKNMYVEDTAETGGQITINSLTASTTATTGALTVSGGVGMDNDVNVAGDVKSFSTVQSLTNSSGSIVATAGGMGIAKNLYIGDLLATTGFIEIENDTGDTMTLDGTSPTVGAHIRVEQAGPPALALGSGDLTIASSKVTDAAGIIVLEYVIGSPGVNTLTVTFNRTYTTNAPTVVVDLYEITSGLVSGHSYSLTSVTTTDFIITFSAITSGSVGDQFGVSYQVFGL